MRTFIGLLGWLALGVAIGSPGVAVARQVTNPPDGLLFHMSADTSVVADLAQGQAEPTFADS